MYFDPFSPSWLLIYKPHSQNHCLSDPPGSRCTCRPSLIQSDINRIEAMGSHEKRERGREIEMCTWIRAFLMTRLTSSLHSATSGFCSSRLDEKASRCDRKYSAQKTGNTLWAWFFFLLYPSSAQSFAPQSAFYMGKKNIFIQKMLYFWSRCSELSQSKGREL